MFSASSQAAAEVLRDIGYTADDVARSVHKLEARCQSRSKETDCRIRTLKDVFNVAGSHASQILKDIGYAANEVDRLYPYVILYADLTLTY